MEILNYEKLFNYNKRSGIFYLVALILLHEFHLKGRLFTHLFWIIEKFELTKYDKVIWENCIKKTSEDTATWKYIYILSQ